jgi:[acyl-carrier-protein] S-malonyltransferase
MKIVYVFPGQSSRYPEMIEKLLTLGPWNGEIIDRASDVLWRDLRAHFNPRNESIFARNRDIQIGVFLANHMSCESLRMAGVSADLSLGLSLGEYNHLVHIGALDFDQALKLLDARGQAYEEGPEGAMASVFPIEFDELCQVRECVSHLGRLEIAIRNTPQQHVIAGERAALEASLAILEEEYFIQGVMIENRIPMHTSLFEPVAEAFRPALQSAAWKRPTRPYLPNVLGRFVSDPGPAQFTALLSEHVCGPVLWQESIEFLADRYTDLVMVEVGPRAVLYNMLGKRWMRDIPKYKTDSPNDLFTSFMALAEELTDGVYRTTVLA